MHIIGKIIFTPILFALCLPFAIIIALVDIFRLPIEQIINMWEDR